MELSRIIGPAYFLEINDDIGIQMDEIIEALQLNKISNVFVSNEDFDKIETYFKGTEYFRNWKKVADSDGMIVSRYESIYGTIDFITIK